MCEGGPAGLRADPRSASGSEVCAPGTRGRVFVSATKGLSVSE